MSSVSAPLNARKLPIKRHRLHVSVKNKPSAVTTTGWRKRLRTAGFDPIPVKGKIPPMTGWQKLAGADDKTIEAWAKAHPAAKSTGILTARTPTLDIDITDDAAATDVENFTNKRFS